MPQTKVSVPSTCSPTLASRQFYPGRGQVDRELKMKQPMSDNEVRSRLEAMERYNAYFARETDEKGNPLTHQMVGQQQRWNIMTREWGVDPMKFGITKPPEHKGDERKTVEVAHNDL